MSSAALGNTTLTSRGLALASKVPYLVRRGMRALTCDQLAALTTATGMDYDREFLTGTVGVLILSLLSERAMYGYEILQEAERRSASQFQMKEGTLYPALHQMERAGFLKAAWRESDTGRARKYYSLTPKGRRHADSKRRQWESISAAMRAILGAAHGSA